LESHPELRVQLRGEAATVDLERLRDDAVLGQLGSDKDSTALRSWLEARIAGAPPPALSDAETTRLDALRGALPLPAEQRRTLAADRAAGVVAAMTLQQKVDPARTSATPPATPQSERELAPQPGVTIELRER